MREVLIFKYFCKNSFKNMNGSHESTKIQRSKVVIEIQDQKKIVIENIEKQNLLKILRV